jgi:hypothetical protein
MWQPPPITRDNLRQIVRDAPKGAEISVPPGEFEGPFILDRSLRLVGRGNHPKAITLWTRRGPAVIVLSPGVSLSNLNVELTWPEARQSDVTLWYAAGCQPDTQGAQIQGRVEQMGISQSGSGWNLPNIIDLGDLRAKCSITLPMVIEVPGPASIRGELSDLCVEPGKVDAAGQHLLRIGIPGDKLLRDTMLAGQLVVESSGETRSVWIIGRVLEDEFKAWVRDKIILVGQSGRKFGFDLGVLLGKEQLKGESGADRIAEKQAYIMKEPSGVWSLIQPLPVSHPTRVNDQTIGVGQRVLLKGGEMIEVGPLKLIVEAQKTDLPITVDGSVDFGKLSARATATPPVITVRNNQGRQKWEGTLRSTVPWIQVPQPQVVCQGGKTVQVAVQLGTCPSSLPRQQINYTGALMLEGAKETWFISAQLAVDVEEGLEVEPSALDFGRVSDPAMVAPQRLRLRNTGRTDWQGAVQVAVPWLAVDRTSLQCAAGAEMTLEVRLTDQVMALPEGANAIAKAFEIDGQGLSVPVAARLHFDKPKVQLDVQPRSLDWDKVIDWRAAKPQTILLRNTGTKDWQGKAESKVPWLEVTPVTLQCPVQGKATLTVRLTDQFQSLVVGEQKAPAAVRIEGEGLSFSFLARLVVEAPEIEPDTTLIDLVLDDRSALPHYALHLRNRGSQDWRGVVKSTLRWLVVSPTDVTCPAGGEVLIDVTLGPDVSIFKRARTVRVDNAIRIEGQGQPLLVGARLEIKEPAPPGSIPVPPPPPVSPPVTPTKDDVKPPKDVVKPPVTELVVDFGAVSNWSGALPMREIRLTNSQPQVMNGTVRSTLPWLAVTPASFSCPPGQEVILTVRLTNQAAGLRPKSYDVADALIIESSGKKHSVRAQLAVVKVSPPKSVSPPITPTKERVKPPVAAPPPAPLAGLVVDFGAVSDWSGPLPAREIHLANSQPQVMNGTVRSTLPWLEVTPTSFSCPPGQEVILTVRLTNQAAGLRPKSYDVADALVIESGDKRTLIRAHLTMAKGSPTTPVSPPVTPARGEVKPPVAAPPPAPLAGLVVDFGAVSDWSGPLPAREIRLANSQPQVMNGTVRSTLPWLEVTPTSFSCPPGQEVILTVRLTNQATVLRPKTYDVADALVIECNDEKCPVKAHLEVIIAAHPLGMRTILPPRKDAAAEPAQPALAQKPKSPQAAKAKKPSKALPEALVVEPTFVDWGTVSDWSGSLPVREIELYNGLKTDWSGTICSTVPWLEVAPAEVTCPAGERVTFQARLTKYGSHLRTRTYSAANALVIEGGGQTLSVGASLTVGKT